MSEKYIRKDSVGEILRRFETDNNDVLIGDIAMAIDNLQTIELPHWHDLRKNPEDLPEDGQRVLTCKNGRVSILNLDVKTKHWNEDAGNWWWSFNMVDKWMVLPKDED